MIPLGGTKRWNKHLRGVLERALAAGECFGAEEMAASMPEWLRANENPFTAWVRNKKKMKEKPEAAHRLRAIPSSTVSTRFSRMEIRGFLANLNGSMRSDARRMLKAYPPDRNESVAIMDGTEYQYWMHKRRNKRIPANRSRQEYSTTASASNKSSDSCHTWLCVTLFWLHRGHPITYPIMLEILSPLEHRPGRQVDAAFGALRLMGVKPGALIVDQGYDSPDVRRIASEVDIPVIQRIQTKFEKKRWVTLPGGVRKSIRELMEEATNELLPVYTAFWPKTNERFQYRLKQVPCRIGDEGVQVNLVLQVGLSPPTGTRKNPKWTLRTDRCMALVGPLDFGAPAMRRVYLLRHRIETFFEELALDRAGDRPKTIQAHVVGFASYVYRFALAQARHIATLMGLNGDPAIPKRYVTMKQASQEILEPDEDELEPAVASAG